MHGNIKTSQHNESQYQLIYHANIHGGARLQFDTPLENVSRKVGEIRIVTCWGAVPQIGRLFLKCRELLGGTIRDPMSRRPKRSQQFPHYWVPIDRSVLSARSNSSNIIHTMYTDCPVSSNPSQRNNVYAAGRDLVGV